MSLGTTTKGEIGITTSEIGTTIKCEVGIIQGETNRN